MTAFPTYSTGTVSIAANATSVVGTGSNWTGVNAVAGDLLVVAGQTVIVQDVTDATHLAIDAWPFAAVTAASYKIYKVSPLRFVGGQAMLDVSTLVGALKTNGFYVFVGPDETVPDPSLGSDGQFALQANTGKLWEKVGGIWNFVGIQKGFSLPKPWDAVTTWQAFDVASDLGTSYVAIAPNTNQRPPNATFWTVLAAKGDTGSQGIQGASYGGTSTTSLAVGTGSKAFTTQAGLAYTNGARVRASSAANTSNWMEGLVTYSGTTLTINVDKSNGSGTHADWNLNVVGQPGAGDLSSANNLSDVSSVATARTNLGAAASATTISGGGLVTGGGDLSANRTVTVTAAAKTDQTTGTSNSVAVTPAHQQDHDSACKAWVSFTGQSATGAVPIDASYNVASVTKTANAGVYTVTFTTPFSTANYCCGVTCEGNSTVGVLCGVFSGTPKTSSAVTVVFENAGATVGQEPVHGHVHCFGRQ